jgi:GntR family transcriptional regulator/MocR family aminotransferase
MSRGWTFPVSLDPHGHKAIYLQIADALAADIARGRLRPGQPLPGTRTLAAQLGVHRSTVLAAYAELCAQGATVTRPAGATLVSDARPATADSGRPPRPARTPGFDLPAAAWAAIPGAAHASARGRVPSPPGALALWGGVPDLRLLPADTLGRALRRSARLAGRRALAYTAERRGHPALRRHLAGMLAATRGLAITADNVLVTQGSQMALDLLARTLLRPGDAIAVEAIGYGPAFGTFAARGARLVPVPVDADGLDVQALAAACARDRLRAVYLTPQHQYPTTVLLSRPRRAALLALARQHSLAIIEDDYDHEFHYDGRPVLPLASADRGGHVVYLGSLAKILAPGLRIGFVAAPVALIDRLADERLFVDRQGVTLIEAAVADLLEEGEVLRHVRRARRHYQRRRDALVDALRVRLPRVLDFTVPPGGMALWTRAEGVDVARWQEAGARAGVLFQIGAEFTLDGRPLPCLRLGFALCDEGELATAVRRLAGCLPRRPGAARSGR